jgi:glutathione S-transferase
MELFYHPLSRYSQKVLLALYEKQANFYPRVTELQDPLARKQFHAFYPLGKLPLLKTHMGRLIPEASIIIEYLDRHFGGGTRLLPADPERNFDVRLYDRLLDDNLNSTLFARAQILAMPEKRRDELRCRQLEKLLTVMLTQLDNRLAENYWLCGDSFTLADCALLPCLDEALENRHSLELANLHRYRQQANLRGSWALVLEEMALAQANASKGARLIP